MGSKERGVRQQQFVGATLRAIRVRRIVSRIETRLRPVPRGGEPSEKKRLPPGVRHSGHCKNNRSSRPYISHSATWGAVKKPPDNFHRPVRLSSSSNRVHSVWVSPGRDSWAGGAVLKTQARRASAPRLRVFTESGLSTWGL